MEKRVVITGTGILSPSGITNDEFFDNLINGRSGLSELDKDHPDLKDIDITMCGKIRNWKPCDYLSLREIKRLNINGQYITYCSQKAIEQSGLDVKKVIPERAGVIMGAVFGGWSFLEEQYLKFKEKGGKYISPLSIPKLSTNTMISMLSILYGFMGPSYSINAACASATIGIGESFLKIKSGELDVCITGGVDAEIFPFMLHAFNNMKALSKKNSIEASSPFTLGRDGFVLSEGAACIIIEELEHAKKRGATILAEIVGFGSSADAYHVTSPHPEGKGAVISMEKALKMANINSDKIGYINAHGTSTYLNDKVETIAMKKVFGDNIYNIPVSSTKSMTGHLLGAAGGIEAIALLLPLLKGIIPPTINYNEKDPELDLDYVPNKARECNINYAMSNSLGFGGQNGSLILKKYV
ncbi:MAG: beta-ketoacyl-[acyl-carrier-protein] synthase II [Candidatus Muirbacterium halophilum]|nr:beta-ketoacyl-[acyl-carrier-protein] synthase II [Candidatus Muirbacterium halophilum]